ncbi:MAG: hypothetical protein IJ930_10090 [Lachnospiraceae bacterium]|nr:hypothetical protein [Lachnospiraceae bacterium]
MERDDILAMSRQENHGQDIAEIEVSRMSMQLGWITAVCLLAAVSVVDAIVFGRVNNEVFFAVMASLSVVFFAKYLKLRKKHELYIAIIYAVAAVLFFIAWVLQLAGL